MTLDPLTLAVQVKRLEEFHNDDSADERFAGIGTRTYHGTIHYRYSSGYETDRALSYHNVPTQQAAYARTIYDGPTSFYGGSCGCGCDAGLPSPRAFSSYGWSVAGSGQGAIRETWHADHTRNEDWWLLIGATLFGGDATSYSSDDWTYDLTFSEEKPLGTSPYAWRYTGVEGSGWGFFFANRESQASADYQTSVKQGTATLNGLKTYGETLTETNDYTIGFGLTTQGKIAFELDGLATQSLDKKSTYEGHTGTVVFGGGNGTISLDESGCATSCQCRQVDFSYRNGSYQADAQATRNTNGHHTHNYQETYAYASEDYSYSSSAAWGEGADWENELTRYHSFANSNWATL